MAAARRAPRRGARALATPPRLFAQAAQGRRPRAPPSRFGTEVVARLLGLRTNHPAAHDDARAAARATRPRAPRPPTRSRGSCASAARRCSGSQDARRRRSSLPALDALAEADPRRPPSASSAIPYVWGGTSESAETPFGVPGPRRLRLLRLRLARLQAPAVPDEGTLARRLRAARPTQMSGEVPAAQRIPLAKLQPADVIFFGAKGPQSKPAQVDHTGDLPRQRLVHPLLRATASPSRRSPAGTPRASPGDGGRSPRPGCVAPLA